MAENFVRPEEVLDYVHNLVKVNRGKIGLAYVAYASDSLLPKYPAAVVAPGQTTTEKHGTHYFKRTFTVEILVLHARLSASRATRSKEDLELVTRLALELDDDPTCGGRSIFSYTSVERPLNVGDENTSVIIGTQMSWESESRVLFK